MRKYLPLRIKLLFFARKFPKVKKWGWKYLFFSDYRRKCKNREKHERNKARYGSGFSSRRKKYLRYLLAKRDGYQCFWCGKGLDLKTATIDHINPAKNEKNNKIENLRLIHEHCRVERDRLIAQKKLNNL